MSDISGVSLVMTYGGVLARTTQPTPPPIDPLFTRSSVPGLVIPCLTVPAFVPS